MSHTLMNRRRFGFLSMGGATYALLSGCKKPHERMSPDVTSMVDKNGGWHDGLPRSTPEAEGVRSESILNFLNDVEGAGLELHSFMLMRHGQVLAEAYWNPFSADRMHMTHSLTKSVTASGVGLAVDEGLISLDEKVASFFPDQVPADASENIRAMTIRNLLTMQTGHASETSGSLWRPIETSWVTEFFKIPAPYEPGTFFKYTSAASFMLSAIVTKVTGETIQDYMRPRLFEPLGIRKLHWDLSPGGVNPGGNGLSWTTSASLKLGALHAQMGEWNGRQILSRNWVEVATTKHSGDEEEGDYGYQWWIGPGKSYFALGLFSQMSIVFPEHGATLAVFSAIDGSSKLKPHIWKHFPAAFEDEPLPASDAFDKLTAKAQAANLLPVLDGSANADLEGRISGKRYVLSDNDQQANWVSFDFNNDVCKFVLNDYRGEHTISSGRKEYVEQPTSMTGNRLHHQYQMDDMRVVAGAQWIDERTLKLTWHYVETAFRDTVLCRFDGSSVSIDRSVNLNSAETSLPTLSGVLA